MEAYVMPIEGATKGRVAEIKPTEEDEIKIRRITVDDFFAVVESTQTERAGGDAASKSVEGERTSTSEGGSAEAR
jgi:hypothetical protein